MLKKYNIPVHYTLICPIFKYQQFKVCHISFLSVTYIMFIFPVHLQTLFNVTLNYLMLRSGVKIFIHVHLLKVKSMQRSGTETIKTQIQPSKPKREITQITNSQNTKKTYGIRVSSFFQKNVATQQPKEFKGGHNICCKYVLEESSYQARYFDA